MGIGPETLWMYDIDALGGVRFNGRQDRTHTRLGRARPYSCQVEDADGQHTIASYNRGGSGDVKTRDGHALQWTLLRAQYPAADEFGLDDELRLTLHEPESPQALGQAREAPRADQIIRCGLVG